MSSNSDEQEFKIQPHPQDNHSNTETPAAPSNSTQAALAGNPGPAVLDSATASNLEAPKSRDELAQISADLNEGGASQEG